MDEECGAALAPSPLQTPGRQGRLFSCCFQEAICWFLSKRKASLPPSCFFFFFKLKLSRPCELLRSVSTVALSLGNWLSEVARELLEVSLLLIKWNSWISNRFQILCDSSSFLHNLCDSKASSAMCLCSSLCIHGSQGLGTALNAWSPTGHCHSIPFAFPGALSANNAHGDGFPTAASWGSSFCSDPVNIVSLRAEHHLYVPAINEVMVPIPYICEVLVWKIIFGRITMHSFPTLYKEGDWQCLIFFGVV